MFLRYSRAPSSVQKRSELQTCWCRLRKSFRRWYQTYSKYRERVSTVEKRYEFRQRLHRPQVGESGGCVCSKSAVSMLGILLPVQGVEPKSDWISPLASIRCKRVWRCVQVIVPHRTFRYVLKETQCTRNPSTWCIHVLRSPNFFSREWKQVETWKLLKMAWLFFRLGDAKWQHCPTRWIFVTSSSVSSVLDTSNGDIYVRRTRDYRIPPFAWYETHRNSSIIEWNMQLWCYGCEKCEFVGTTVQRRPNVVWKQTEGASPMH